MIGRIENLPIPISVLGLVVAATRSVLLGFGRNGTSPSSEDWSSPSLKLARLGLRRLQSWSRSSGSVRHHCCVSSRPRWLLGSCPRSGRQSKNQRRLRPFDQNSRLFGTRREARVGPRGRVDDGGEPVLKKRLRVRSDSALVIVEERHGVHESI